MARVFLNDFSWSKSRHEKLSECSRAYYLYYYGSWGGWALDAPAEARQAYVLKKLANRYTWAGSVVHDAIRDVLLDVRLGRPVDADKVVERAHLTMKEDFRQSARKAYWTEKPRKDFAGLMEHEYADAVTGDQWKQNWESAKAALGWFLGSRWMALARALPRERWLEVDSRNFEDTVFNLEDVRVFAIPDFAYVDEGGCPVVVDWKTGKVREGYEEQVLGYALYLSTRYGFRVDAVKAALVYLNEGQEHVVPVDAAAVESFKAHFRKSVARMRELLADPANNVPKARDAFPMTEDAATCARCSFRKVCGREGAVAQAAAKVA